MIDFVNTEKICDRSTDNDYVECGSGSGSGNYCSKIMIDN